MKKHCDVCNRETNRTYRIYGYVLCAKHMHQIYKYGKFLDNNQRTNSDLNDYQINNSIVTFNLYNQKNEKNGEFIIDFEDIEKVKYKKWRISHNHIVTGLPSKGTQRDLSHIILDVKPNGINDFVVDHINGNPFDNRKENLRVCSQSKNVQNKKFMSNNTQGFIGVTYDKSRELYDSEIRYDGKRCHLGRCKSLKEAVYKRFVAENLIFMDYCNLDEHMKKFNFTQSIPNNKKEELFDTVYKKLNVKFFGNKLC